MLFPLISMDTSLIAKRVFVWWYNLLKDSGYDSKIGVDPLLVETRIGIQEQEGVVYFKFAPRYFFFSFDFGGGNAVFNTFIPEIDFEIQEDKRDEFCGRLESHLNEPLSTNGRDEFSKFFTPPVKVSFQERNFRDEDYTGVSIGTKTNPMCFSKSRDRMRSRALKNWRKKIFIPAYGFFESQDNLHYLTKKD